MKEIIVSKEQFEKCKKEYVAILDKLADAKKDFNCAKTEEEKDELQLKIKRLEIKELSIKKNLNNMTVSDEINNEIINIGDTVTIKYVDDDELFEFKLVGSNGNFEDSEISILSPLGSSVYGKEVGDITSFKVNKNAAKPVNIRILSKK